MAEAPSPVQSPLQSPPVPSGLAVVHEALDELTEVVEGARSMPMSASCVVNRAEVLGLLDDLRTRLPEALDEAHEVLGDRSAVVEGGRHEAEALLATAREEREEMLSGTAVLREAEAEARQLVEQGRAEAAAMRAEVEDYVDAKLANFEVVLAKTLEAVERGRAKLSGVSDLDGLTGA